MRTKSVFALVAVVALAGAAAWYFAGGSSWFGPAGGSGERGPGEDAPDLAEGGAREGGAAPSVVGDRAGALAARRRPERRGVGGVALRVVRVGTEAPIEGAAVTVTGSGHGGEAVEVRAATDAQGHVALASVAAGEGYEVRVQAAGDPGLSIPDVEVRAGKTKDLGTVVVGARAPLSGRVVDENGAAVAGADVRAFVGYENFLELMGNMMELFSSLGREPTPLAKTKSDAEGKFRLDDLPPGTIAVRATAPGRRQAVVKVRLTAQGPASGPPTLVLEPGVAVAGVVVDTTGAGVPAATLAMLDEDDNDDPLGFLTNRLFATTDAKGAFEATVSEGSKGLRAVVEAAGFPTTMSAKFRAGDKAVRIVVSRGAEIEVTLRDAGGTPVSGGQVLVGVAEKESFNDDDGGGGILFGVTDDRGVVVLPSPTGAIEVVMVHHPLHGAGMTRPGGKDQDQGFDGGRFGLEGDVPKNVKAGEPTRMTLTLARSVVLTGRVTGPGGAPVAGADVRTMNFMAGGGGTTARSGADGTYRLTGLTQMPGAGAAFVMVRASGYVPSTSQVPIDDAALRAGEAKHDVALVPGATVRGVVRDAAGAPVAGAEVTVGADGDGDMARLFGRAPATTALDGTYVLRDVDATGKSGNLFAGAMFTADAGGESEEPKGPHKTTLRASAEGFVPGATDPFVVPEGGDVEAPPLRLSRGATISGIVREPGGGAAAGAQVDLWLTPDTPQEHAAVTFGGMSSSNRRQLRADAAGRFRAAAVPKGTATFTARRAGFAASQRIVKVESEADVSGVEVVLRPALEMRGRVVGPDGRPVAGAVVTSGHRIEGRDGDDGYAETVTATTDAEGHFVLRGLPSGSLNVTVAAEGHRNASTNASPGAASVEIRLEARPADATARLKEIQQELQEVFAKFGTVKDSAERAILQERMMALMKEQRELTAGDQADGAVAPVEVVPAREPPPEQK